MDVLWAAIEPQWLKGKRRKWKQNRLCILRGRGSGKWDHLELLRPDIPKYETEMLLYQDMQALIAVVICL